MTILDTIIEHKKTELPTIHAQRHLFNGRHTPRRPFIEALNRKPKLSIIAEVKKASPSKGVIQPNFDPVTIAHQYENGRAQAISVLTDNHFFQGHEDFLVAVRKEVSLPVLRKDFIIDPIQVEQTAYLGADALLLIAACLSDEQMKELYDAASGFHIDSLFEVHNHEELERVLKCGPQIIGINNRDLKTFTTDIQTTLSLLNDIPSEIPIVSESGIFNTSHTRPLIDAGVSAILVGESLMRSDNIPQLIRELTLEDV